MSCTIPPLSLHSLLTAIIFKIIFLSSASYFHCKIFSFYQNDIIFNVKSMLSWYNPFYLLNKTASWMFTQAEYKGQVDIEEWKNIFWSSTTIIQDRFSHFKCYTWSHRITFNILKHYLFCNETVTFSKWILFLCGDFFTRIQKISNKR